LSRAEKEETGDGAELDQGDARLGPVWLYSKGPYPCPRQSDNLLGHPATLLEGPSSKP